MDVFLKKEVYESNKDSVNALSDDGFVTYVGLRMLYMLDNEKDCITANRIAYKLYGYIPNKKIMIRLRNGLQECINSNIVKIDSELNKSEYLIDMTNLHLDTSKDFFVIINDNEIKKILTMDGSNDKFCLLRYFCCCIGSFSHDTNELNPEIIGKIGYMSTDYLAMVSNTYKDKITRKNGMNNILERLKLLYINRPDDFTVKDEEVKRMRNIYSRYEDRHWCDLKFESYRLQGYNAIKNKKIDSNEKRSLRAKINYLFSDEYNKTYTQNEIKELKDYAIEFNSKQEFYNNKMYQRDGELLAKDTIDVSQFDKFLICEQEEKIDNIWGKYKENKIVDFSTGEIIDKLDKSDSKNIHQWKTYEQTKNEVYEELYGKDTLLNLENIHKDIKKRQSNKIIGVTETGNPIKVIKLY